MNERGRPKPALRVETMIRPVHGDLFPQDLQAMLMANTMAKRHVTMVEERPQPTVNRACRWKLRSAKGALVMSVCVMACLVLRQWEEAFVKQLGCGEQQQL
uniref:Uncharacterized protein n=1 Tax=Plectus sambesii TaxID=2011161 RepID=A0A914UZY1_9BILA